MGTEARIPQAGMTVIGEIRKHTELIERFEAAYAGAMQWCQNNSQECASEVAERISMLTAEKPSMIHLHSN